MIATDSANRVERAPRDATEFPPRSERVSIVPELSTCQPRFVLYAQAHGLQAGDEWVTWEYMAWITRVGAEYRKARGLREIIEDHGDFTRFIEERVYAQREPMQMRLSI